MAGRSVVEIMVLMLTATVCTAVVLGALAVAVVEIVNPTADTTVLSSSLGSTLSVLLGAVLGMLAGRGQRLTRRPDEEPPG